MNKTSATKSKQLLFSLIFLFFYHSNFAHSSGNNLMVCPDGNSVSDDNSEVCSGDGTGSFAAWQNAVNVANPLDATQDPDGLGTIVYSSVPPVAGTALPNGFVPTGMTIQSDFCIVEDQSTAAYLYCDADASGTVNVGDTYTLLSSFSLLVYPAIQEPVTTDNSCEITITAACSDDVITLSNQSIPTGVITNNGTNEVTYTAAAGDPEGTVDITIVSAVANSLCTYTENIPSPDCPIEGCPIPVVVADDTGVVCAGGGVDDLLAWQQSVDDANPLDNNQDSGGFGEIVYSTVPPVPGGQEPILKLPTGIFDGPDFCRPEEQSISAYLHCTQPGNESYTILSSYTLTVYPPPMSVVVTMDGSTCGNPTVELRANNGDVCETLSGNCTSNGVPFNYDFATTATGMALADAPVGCTLPAAGSIDCSNCFNIILTDDPCSCDDPLNYSFDSEYYFHEVIEISAMTGQSWNLTGLNSGELYDDSGVLLTYPLPLTDNMDGTYSISVWVLDGQAYDATFAEGGGNNLSIANSCSLPTLDVSCPADLDLGTFDCTNLEDIEDCPTTIAELIAAPYNFVIDENTICGTLVIECEEESIDVCNGDEDFTREITVFDDLNEDGIQQGAEPSESCEFTFEVLGDEEEPTINEAEGELDGTISLTDPDGSCVEDFLDVIEDFVDDPDDFVIEDANGSVTGIMFTDPENGMTWTFNAPTATDNCGITITELDDAGIDEDDECDIIMFIEWFISDDCGIEIEDEIYTQIITVTDAAAPVLEDMAENETVSCDNPDIDDLLEDWLDDNGGADASDNCEDVEWSYTPEDPTLTGDACTQSVEVTFTAEDPCGNEVSTTATFTVTDSEAPMITTQAMNATASCTNSTEADDALAAWLANNGGAVAIDNCSFAWSNNATPLTLSGDDCTQSAEITFTATDACGNAASTTATFTVTDSEAPMITTQATDENISCDNNDITGALNTWLTSNGGAVATDNCDFEWTNNFMTLADDGCSQTATVTFTATDDCDNSASTTATFTVTDSEAPMIGTQATDENISCDNADITGALNAWLMNNGGAVATDNCDFEWTNNFMTLADDGCSQTATVTFTATDDCDNSASTTATFTVTDSEAPMIGTQATDENISCDNADITGELNAWLMNNGGAVATDNCDFEWTNNFSTLADDGCSQTATVTFTATDDCDNSASTTATFTVTDSEAPMITTQATDENISCDNNDITGALNTWLMNNGGAVATDNCDFEWTNNFTTLADDGCSQTATVTFTATDDCDNSASTTATFTVTDSEAPMISTQATDENISCDNADIPGALNTWLMNNGGAVATDNCDFEWTNNFTTLADDGCSQTATVTFTATDDCDNSASTTAIFTVTDSEAPMITTQATDESISCDNADITGALNTWLMNNGGAVATDNCDFEWTNNFTTLADDGCSQTATVTFTATDDCDNSASTTATFTVTDSEAPMIGTEAMDENISCDNADITGALNTWLANNGGAVAADNCDFEWTNNFSGLVGNTCNQFATVTFVATDNCGNSASTTATFSVTDMEGPVIGMPPNVSGLTCFETAGEPATNVAEFLAIGGTISDNCSSTFTVLSQQTTTGDFCPNGMPYSIMRTYFVVDECGNTSTGSTPHVIQYENSSNGPMITNVLATCYKYCSDLLNPMESDITYTTDCALGATVAITGPVVDGPENCNGTSYEFTYTVTDDCGRTDSATRTFIIGNNGPTIEHTSFNLILDCGDPDNADYIETHLGLASANTSCGLDATITYAPTVFDDLLCGDSRVVTFMATDACGRTATATTTIALQDPEPPVFTVIPPPFCDEIPCSADVDGWYSHWLNYMIEGLEATDNCTPNPTILGSNPALNTICTNGEAVTVVNFVASDDCGNSSTITATFTILSVPPIFTFVPQDATIACGDTPVFGMATASDECGNVTVTFNDVQTGDNCTGMIVRTWTATNDCAVSTTAETTITFTNLPTEDPTASIIGTIATEYLEAVSGVNVTLENGMALSLNQETENDGAYVFSDLTLNDNYSVTPFLDEDPLNGVSSFDLILIARHILQIQTLDSPYKLIAADVNRNGSITTMDMVHLRKLILHIDDNFVNNTSWRFVEADYVFPNPANPFETIFPEVTYVNGLASSEMHDFVGVKIGDVNNTVQASDLLEIEDRSGNGSMNIKVEDRLLPAGEKVDVAFKAADLMQLSAFQFSLNFDQNQLDFVQLSEGGLDNLNESNFGFSKLDQGGITSSWHKAQPVNINTGDTLFVLTFRARNEIRLSEVLHINSRFTKAEAYDAGLNLLNVKLRFNSNHKNNNTFVLYDNKPNPFKESTTIGFNLPRPGKATMKFFDLSGRLVHQVSQSYDAGYNEVVVSHSDLSSDGVYYYQLITSGFEETKKMLLQKL